MVRIDEICTLNMGQSPESSSYNEKCEGLPFFQGNADFGEVNPNIRLWCKAPTKVANIGDILISVRAPIGALNIANVQCCIGRGLAALTVNEGRCLKRYFWYAISSKVDELISKGTGSTFKAISKGVLAETELRLPNKKEQAIIAAILDKTAALISARKCQLIKLDNLVKSRFIEMFGDPVGNPQKWNTTTFRQSCVRLSDGPFGSNLKSEHYTSDGVRVIRLGNIGVGVFIDNDRSFVSKEHYKTLKKYTCKAGEIVIGTLGEPNLRACIVPETVGFAINKADCVHYIPKAEILNSIFACQYINCPETLQLASGMVHGQTRARISSGQIAEMPIFIPPLALQTQFAAFVHQVDKSKFVFLLKKY